MDDAPAGPDRFEVNDFQPPRMIAVTNSSGSTAWIEPRGEVQPSGTLWLVAGEPSIVAVLAHAIQQRCAEHRGWTNWAWVREVLAVELRSQGLRMADRAVGLPAGTHLRSEPTDAVVMINDGQVVMSVGMPPEDHGLGFA